MGRFETLFLRSREGHSIYPYYRRMEKQAWGVSTAIRVHVGRRHMGGGGGSEPLGSRVDRTHVFFFFSFWVLPLLAKNGVVGSGVDPGGGSLLVTTLY